MLQRNTSGYPLDLPTLGLGRLIHPGEDFDHEERLAGFTPVDELETDESDTSDKSGDEEALDTGDATGGEPDTETTPAETASDTETSTNAPSSGAQPDTDSHAPQNAEEA